MIPLFQEPFRDKRYRPKAPGDRDGFTREARISSAEWDSKKLIESILQAAACAAIRHA